MNKYEQEHIARLRTYLPECTVLLKKNGAFPLEGPCRIAAVGAGARNTIKGGTGSGEVNSRYSVTIEQGLRDAGFEVVGSEWADEYRKIMDEARPAQLKEIKAKAKADGINTISALMGAVIRQPEYDIPLPLDCDAAIYVVARISGEGNDRLAEKGDFLLTDSEVRDIRKLNEFYDKFLLVINAGGPVDLTPVLDVGNILVLSQLGVETGAALADIILGKAYPSGKLTTTWSAIEDYADVGTFGDLNDTLYREGIYVGYRWFDANDIKPVFPFGYGLGYTEWKIEDWNIAADGPVISAEIAVSNIGSYAGKEAVQLYVSCPAGRLDREVKSLAGFAKTKELAPGESDKLTITFDIRDLATYDEGCASWILEKGEYILLTGDNSADVSPGGVLELGEDVTVRKVRNVLGGAGLSDWRNEKPGRTDTAGLQRIVLDPAALIDTLPNGSNKAPISDYKLRILDHLNDRELATLSIGAFDPKKLMPSVIGDSGFTVPGAAGESAGALENKGIQRITMADGPAGVRIASRYYEDRKGKHPLQAPLPETMTDIMPAMGHRAASGPKVPKHAEIHEQYCTAIPIATAIAQSFNTEFAEVCGDIVGSEMEMFGVDLWLAPALNIHRNVLCGRNFEYYSEDPLMSGKFAAAITRGVQAHPGRGVTIKHFACNNQETNRYASNSIISERAAREIYLKGFGICIRESDPVALMTSYNLLNGEHTSESRALTTNILRSEFRFKGMVMTDWVIGNGILLSRKSKYGIPDAAVVAAAGSSLFMPGCRKDFKEVLNGLRTGKVTRAQLIINAGWLVYAAERLGKR